MSLKPAARIHRRIAEIGREAWDACALPYGNPFMLFDFLDICEESGCAVEKTGWGPQHIVVEDETGGAAGVMPLYLKSHSQGEYVFDYGWAEAYERAGGQYYPKLLCAAPFTPVTGPRLMARPDVGASAKPLLLGAALGLCGQYEISSLHLNFLQPDDWEWMGREGLAQREGRQYHWFNRGYTDFDGFLAALSSGRRKTIKRERREAQEGLEIVCLTGSDLKEEHWDAFYRFYMDTGSRKWGRPYLNRKFFSLLGERMADRVLLVMARRSGRWIAGAFNMIGDDCLFGRNWGCVEHVPFLHFELCYYQAIEWAIGRGLARVEAGAQGEHKIARGYLPHAVYSAHYIADPALRAPVERFVAQERLEQEANIEWLAEEYSPFKHEEGRS